MDERWNQPEQNQQTEWSSATTTMEQDRRSAGQRKINRLWEYTQSAIAVSVTLAVLYAAVFVKDMAMGQFIFLTSLESLIIGFYFGRTNHTRTGGVGGDVAGSR